MSLLRKIAFVVLILALLIPLSVFATYTTIAHSHDAGRPADVIIVLGSPTQPDGTPSPEMRERVLEGVREYKAGAATHMIMTGAAAHNSFVEAHAMALFAEKQGVPASAVIEEPKAQNTIQNIYYSEAIMDAQHWSSAEVVSSPSHLPRTALILQHQPIKWETHAAQWPPEYSLKREALLYMHEAIGCFRLRWFGFPASKFMPA